LKDSGNGLDLPIQTEQSGEVISSVILTSFEKILAAKYRLKPDSARNWDMGSSNIVFMPHYHEAIRTFLPIVEQLQRLRQQVLFLLSHNDSASQKLCEEFNLPTQQIPHLLWGRHLTGGIIPFFQENFKIRRFVQRFCDEVKPAAIVMTDDRRYVEAFLVSQAKSRHIPTLIVMWAATNDTQAMLAWRQKKAYNQHLSLSARLLCWLVHWLAPQAVKSVKPELNVGEKNSQTLISNSKRPILWQPPTAILGMWLFAGYPEHPWILGGGHADKIAVSGEYFRRMLISNGVCPDKIIVTGHPRHDQLYHDSHRWQKVERSTICQEIGAPSNKKIILLGTPPVAHIKQGTRAGHISPEQMIAYLREVVEKLLSLDDNYHLVIKTHPRDEGQSLPYLEGHNQTLTVIRRYETAKLIAISDLLVCQGSTIVFDAHILGTPTVTFDFYNTPGYDIWAKAGGVLHVTRQTDFLPAIQRLLEDETIQTQLAVERKTFLQHYVRCDGEASKRIVQNILTAINQSVSLRA